MSWFRNAINTGWQGEGLYHFLNIMKFEIDGYSNLSLAPGGIASRDKIGFNILRNGENEYSFVIRINGNEIDTAIYAKPTRSLGVNSFDATQTDPKQIIEDGLATINNDYSGEFEHGMV